MCCGRTVHAREWSPQLCVAGKSCSKHLPNWPSRQELPFELHCEVPCHQKPKAMKLRPSHFSRTRREARPTPLTNTSTMHCHGRSQTLQTTPEAPLEQSSLPALQRNGAREPNTTVRPEPEVCGPTTFVGVRARAATGYGQNLGARAAFPRS